MWKSRKLWWVIAGVWCITIAIATRSPHFTGQSTEQLFSNPYFNSVLINTLLRKAGHVTAFGMLAVFFWMALRDRRSSFIIAWVLATVYGAIDEWHQSFVPNRDGIFTDVLYDSTGALLAMILLKLYIVNKRQRRFNGGG